MKQPRQYTCTRFALKRDYGRYWKVVAEERSGPGFETVDETLTIGGGLTREEAVDLLDKARKGV